MGPTLRSTGTPTAALLVPSALRAPASGYLHVRLQMAIDWEKQGCKLCRDAWSSLAKNVDRSMIVPIKHAETRSLFKCQSCGSLWEEWMGGRGPAVITPEEARRIYDFRG